MSPLPRCFFRRYAFTVWRRRTPTGLLGRCLVVASFACVWALGIIFLGGWPIQSLCVALGAQWPIPRVVHATAAADRFRNHKLMYYSSTCEPALSAPSFSRSRPSEMLVDCSLILSQPPSPSSLDLSHALMNQL